MEKSGMDIGRVLSKPVGVRRTGKAHRFFSVSFTSLDLLMASILAILHPAFVSLFPALSSLFFPADGGSRFFHTVSHPRREYFSVLHV
jgi:hypothetical protein